MKKHAVLLLLIVAIWACSQHKSSSNEGNQMDGAGIYKKYCVICHGVDGKLGVSGAKDITVCTLTEAERIVLIAKGKNTMTPFEGVLSPEEIKAVAAYTMTLK
jgi:mono/diheme cytochrome c family protein